LDSGLQLFDEAFQALTGYTPFRWQRRLFDQLRSGEMPRVCDLPTGLGKTAVIPIWVIALALQAKAGPLTLPRRLIYIVNRRTVVDQATSVVEEMRRRLNEPEHPRWSTRKDVLTMLGQALRSLASTQDPVLAISTLRGELADNEEWKADPSRPAIIIGTIDMVGSKLLFSGYGDGSYWRAQHAGLVGQDSLVIHDEAHLTPAFSDLLHRLAEVQRQANEPRPIYVMELTATSRGGTGPALNLLSEDEADPVTGEVVKNRLDAVKTLRLHTVQVNLGDSRVRERAVETLVELAMQHRDAKAKVLIYVRSPEDAGKVIKSLEKKIGEDANNRTALLTGTLRGHERDKLVEESPVYRDFLNAAASVEHTAWLVSTAAGEVGIDLDADHMVCDLTTLDSMIQRLGRVNRRGGQGKVARVDVVLTAADADKEDKQFKAALEETQSILEEWVEQSGGALNVSPRNLRNLLDKLAPERREKAFAPKPTVPPLTDILLDSWSLTSISRTMPGRPEVAPYLHGLTKDPPETYVVWRKEVMLLAEAEVNAAAVSEWFQACRIEAHERLRDRTDRVQQTLRELLTKHREKSKDDSKDFPVVVLDERSNAQFYRENNETRWLRLSDIVDKGFDLRYRTVVLPVEAGGLDKQGALDAEEMSPVSDVAEQVRHERRRERWIEEPGEDRRQYKPLTTDKIALSLPPELKERERISLSRPTEDDEEGPSSQLLLLALPRQATLDHAETAKVCQTLCLHSDMTAECMERIAASLALPDNIKEALRIAARWHDRGKDRLIWQRYAHNESGEPLAKSTSYHHSHYLGGYRHESGSLLDAAADEEIQKHPERDLILHLIAAHHGWARPHFERSAWEDGANTYSTAEKEEAAAEAMRRFARLQQRFGRWGLAWLESLVRCADIAASQQDTPPPATGPHKETNP